MIIQGQCQPKITEILIEVMKICRDKGVLFSVIAGSAVNEYTCVIAVGTLVPESFVETDAGALEKAEAFLKTVKNYLSDPNTGKGREKKTANPDTFEEYNEHLGG